MKEYNVTIDFGKNVPPDIQGRAMLQMEKFLRDAGVPALVFKKTMADDLKRRLSLTVEDRAKL